MVKFEKTLEFNAVREWSHHYIHYERLKYLIYEIEQCQAAVYKSAQRVRSQSTQPLHQYVDEEQGLMGGRSAMPTPIDSSDDLLSA